MKRNVLTLLCASAAASTALANGSRLPDQDALAVARGDAFAATADDPSAIYYNPAGLGQQAFGEVEAGVSLVTPKSSYEGPGGTASTRAKTFSLPYLYAVEPVQPVSGLAVGLGIYVPFGLSTGWPSDGPFRTVAATNTITVLREAFSVGYDFHNGFSIGASLQDNSLKADLNRGLGYIPGDNFNYTGRDRSAFSYNAGLLWKPTAENSFAVTYQSATSFSLDGTATLTPPVGVSGPGTLQWKYPANIVFAYSYRPAPEWNFEFDYDLTQWSVVKTLTLMSPATGPVPIVFNWKDSAYYDAGVTRYYGQWLFSAGIIYSESSVNDDTWSPSTDDYSKWLWNLGVGYKADGWDLEAAVQWSPSTSRTVSGSPPSAAGQTADGTYTSKVFGLMLQAAYHW